MKRMWAALLASWLLVATGAQAQPREEPIDTAGTNLLAVLRETLGSNEQRETLQPYGVLRAEMPDGRQVELEISWFRYVGDIHIRLVFEGGGQLQSASPDDLLRLRLAPEQALQLAVSNMRRTYGEPTVKPWQGGLMQVLGRADDLNSSYFLDRPFWQSLEARHGGLVVAVPQRGGLLYAPLQDEDAVAALRFSAAALYASAPRRRVSSALYLFQGGHWSVYQAPMALAPQPQ